MGFQPLHHGLGVKAGIELEISYGMQYEALISPCSLNHRSPSDRKAVQELRHPLRLETRQLSLVPSGEPVAPECNWNTGRLSGLRLSQI